MTECFKESFIKEYKKGLLKKRLFSLVYYISLLIPKDKKLIIAYVDYEKIDGELIPYSSDNVHLLCRYIESKNIGVRIHYIPSNQFGSNLKRGLSMLQKVKQFYLLLRAKVILTKMPLSVVSCMFTGTQYQIALGYFIPFKADYWDITQWWTFYSHILNDRFDIEKCSQYKQKVLEHFVYRYNQFSKTNLTFIMPSKYASDIMAKSHNLPREYFKELGSPKGDLSNTPKEISLKDIYHLEKEPLAVILYTPTFRDNIMRKSFDELKGVERAVFGYKNEKEELEEFLLENNILLIIKLHKSFPLYREIEQFYIQDDKSYFKNCYFMDFETEARHDISIYDLFQVSDAMIADYSSISFDYLPFDKPIIYNIPDIEDYRKYRGFSYEPIEEMMAGDRVMSVDELKNAILKVGNGEDNYVDKRAKVLSAVNEVPKGKSIENIYDYIEEILS